METNYSEAMFVLKVNNNCQACKVRLTVALGSIRGVYDIDYNSHEGTAMVKAVVDPNKLMWALAGSGPHAECIQFKLRHPRLNKSSYNENHYDPFYQRNGYAHGPIGYRPTLPIAPGPSSYPYSSVSPYYQQPYPYYHGSDLPPARYVPSYSYTEHNPYADEHYGSCNIM